MPPMPPEATSAPPNGQAPMQPDSTAPVNASDANSSNPQSAKDIADAQAQLLAKAIIEAQNMAVSPPKQFQEGSQQASLDAPGSGGANMSIDTEQEQKVTEQQRSNSSSEHGERVIQPIHDVVMEQKREDMQKRMSELLGDTDAEPTQINTNTAKHVNDANYSMRVQNATQASENIPTPVMAPQQPVAQPVAAPQMQQPVAPVPQYQQVQAGYAQNIYAQGYQQQAFVNPSQNVMAQMQAAAQQQPQQQYFQQQPAMQSMDPRAAALQLQQLQAEEARRVQYEQAAAAQLTQQQAAQLQAQQLAQQQAMAQQQALVQQQAAAQQQAQHKNLRVNDDVVKKAAQATILQSQKQGEPEPEPVQAIQPAYITQLETDLAGDMQKKGKMSEMQRAMMAELADDEITVEASKIKVQPAPTEAEKAKAEVDNTPKEVLAAMQNAASPNIAANPNISSAATEINADIKHD